MTRVPKGEVWFRDRLLTTVFRRIGTPISGDGCHSDGSGGKSLGVAKIAVKLKDFVIAVDFWTFDFGCRGIDTPIPVNRN